MFGSMIVLLPTGLVAMALAMAGVSDAGLPWCVALAALLNGVGVLALWTWLGGIVLDERQLTVLDHLRDFASLQ